MALVYIGIGSNLDKERHVPAAICDLLLQFPDSRVSPIFESEAVNCSGDNYFNLVMECPTSLSITALQLYLKQLELQHGRQLEDQRYAPRTLDLDLLLFDDVVQSSTPILPRPEITTNAFVLWPLALLAPQLMHPVLNVSMQSLWLAFDKSTQALQLAPLQWSAEYNR